MENTKSISDYVREYKSSAEHNDSLWREFAELTNANSQLRAHRDWVEERQWGFGDRAFHYMWYLLLADICCRNTNPSFLEIGVYKGQVLSLWQLLAREFGANARSTGISPLIGTAPDSRIIHKLLLRLNPWYKKEADAQNLYPKADYANCVKTICDAFGLNFDDIRLIRGKSQDAMVKQEVGQSQFDIVYIDGDHSYSVVCEDLAFYAPLIKPNGYLVIDDSSFFQPGTSFFKGHEQVSRAVEEMDSTAYSNVLNVGHNRIYVKSQSNASNHVGSECRDNDVAASPEFRGASK